MSSVVPAATENSPFAPVWPTKPTRPVPLPAWVEAKSALKASTRPANSPAVATDSTTNSVPLYLTNSYFSN